MNSPNTIDVDDNRPPAHVISVGGLGRAIAECLGTIRNDIVHTETNNAEADDGSLFNSEGWPQRRVTIIAAWRPVINICNKLEEISYERGVPFIPLMADSTVIRLGPIVVPGAGACWTCWLNRSAQHETNLRIQSAVMAHYSARPDAGPQGYLRPLAMIAAARLSAIINDLDSSDQVGGYIWQMGIITRQITTSNVVGVANCPRCGMRRSAQSRSYEDMRHQLTYLWRSGSNDA